MKFQSVLPLIGLRNSSELSIFRKQWFVPDLGTVCKLVLPFQSTDKFG